MNQLKKCMLIVLGGTAVSMYAAQEKALTTYKEVGEIVLASEGLVNAKQEQEGQLSVDDVFKTDLSFKELTSFEKKQAVFKLFEELTIPHDVKNSVLMPQSLYELNLLCGEPTTKKTNLLEKIDKTVTPYGSAVLARMLINPINDTQKLNKRAQFVQKLVTDEALFNAIEQLLQDINTTNNSFLAVFKKDTPWNKKQIMDSIYFPVDGYANRCPKIIESFRQFVYFSLYLNPLLAFSGYLLFKANNPPRTLQSRQRFNQGVYLLGYGAAGSFLELFQAPFIYKPLKFMESLRQVIQQVMIDTAKITNGLEKLHTFIKNNPELRTTLELYPQLQNFIEKGHQQSEELKYLLKTLKTRTFKGKPSFFSYMGRVQAAYKYLLAVKDQFAPALEAVGEIDAYMSAAKLVKESKNKRVQYCIAEFIENDTPFLALENAWNVLIDPQVVVTENITFGNRHIPNMLLTGPNGSGKSTFMRLAIYNVILPQTFGIAAASRCQLTPFAKITTYLNIREDYEHGLSTFMAERKRVDDIKTIINKTQPGQFVFNISDEMFKGTKEEQGSKRVYEFGQFIANRTDCLCILATHFTSPVKLEADTHGKFKNFHVGIQKLGNLSYKRLFKLVTGPNDWWLNNPQECDNFIEWLQTVA